MLRVQASLGGLSRPLVPGKVEGVGFGLGCPFLGVLHEVVPAVLLHEGDRLLLGAKVDLKKGDF